MSSATDPKTIVLISVAGRSEEALAGGAITPGDLVGVNSAGKYIRNASDAAEVERIFAKENALHGDDIDTAYAADERVFLHVAGRGDVVYANLKDGEVAVIGTKLTSGADGLLIAASSTAGDPVIAVSLDALSPSGANGRIRVRLV